MKKTNLTIYAIFLVGLVFGQEVKIVPLGLDNLPIKDGKAVITLNYNEFNNFVLNDGVVSIPNDQVDFGRAYRIIATHPSYKPFIGKVTFQKDTLIEVHFTKSLEKKVIQIYCMDTLSNNYGVKNAKLTYFAGQKQDTFRTNSEGLTNLKTNKDKFTLKIESKKYETIIEEIDINKKSGVNYEILPGLLIIKMTEATTPPLQILVQRSKKNNRKEKFVNGAKMYLYGDQFERKSLTTGGIGENIFYFGSKQGSPEQVIVAKFYHHISFTTISDQDFTNKKKVIELTKIYKISSKELEIGGYVFGGLGLFSALLAQYPRTQATKINNTNWNGNRKLAQGMRRAGIISFIVGGVSYGLSYWIRGKEKSKQKSKLKEYLSFYNLSDPNDSIGIFLKL